MGDLGRDGDNDRSRQLERELEESQRQLAETEELARIGSWQWELGEWRSTWSKELLCIFGRDPEGPPPTIEELIDSVHPEDRPDFRKLVARIRAAHGPFEHSYRIRGAGGEIHHMQARGRTVADAEGKPIRAFGTTQDISDLKRSEDDLRLRIEQQAGVAALGRYALATTGLPALMDEAVRMVSSVLQVDLVEVLELDEDEEALEIKAGVGWMPGTIGQKISIGCTQMLHALSEGVALVADYSEVAQTPELLERHGARSGIAVAIDEGDRAYGVICAHSTAPRRFTLDDAHFVQAVGNVLGAAIERERSQEIKAQIEQAQRLEAIGQLAGGVAHDFNNLLLVILSYTERLIAEGGEGETLASLREIERSATSGAELTRQLLLFSRRESPDRTGVDVVTAVRDTEELLRRTIGEHIDLAVDAAPSLPAVNLGAGQLDQILVNLVVNARDALPQGGSVTVSVSALPVTPYGPVPAKGLRPDVLYLLFTVADNGEGMSKEVAAQAFDPFFTTKPRGQGTGLGLATVYGIVNQAGGLVEIDSEQRKGTAVRVYLPVADEVETASTDRDSPEAPVEGETVLVVDNEKAVRTIVSHMLEKHGYRALKAASGAVAETILSNSGDEVDLLLTDVLMPGMTGRELAERIRGQKPDLKVIYMSGYSGDAASPLGPWDDGIMVLEKPFTAAQLIRVVGEVLA